MKILPNIIKLYEYYHQLGLKAINQCSDEGLFTEFNSDSNSIAVIVKHLNGNMLSRWTDFLNSDGEKEWRDRDGEFISSLKDREEILKAYQDGWDCLLATLRNLKEADLGKEVFIRNQGHTALEAINRQLAHIPYHIGQIVYLSRMYAQENWQSLSIAKSQSEQFNADHFKQEKSTKHFTDDFLKN